MKKWQSVSVIAAATLVAVLALSPPLTVHAQLQLTEAQAAALRATPPSLVPKSGNFYSVTFPGYPPEPTDPHPDLPVYRLPNGDWLVDDSSLPVPPPVSTNAPAAARSFLTQQASLASQQRLASPMLDDSGPPGVPDATNSPPQDTPTPPVLLDPGSAPAFGNYWMMAETNWPPFFYDPCPPEFDVWALSDGGFLVDDRGYSWPTPSGSDGGDLQGPYRPAYLSTDLYLDILGVSNSVANCILHGTISGTAYTILSRQSLSTNDNWIGELPLIGAEGQLWTPFQVPTFGRAKLFLRAHLGTDPLGLWLQATGISNNCFSCILHGTFEQTSYDIRSVASLHATNNWATETNFPGASGQFWTPVSIPMSSRPSLFLSARSWVDSTGTGIPDWWWQLYFSTNGVDPYALCPCGDGWTILQAFQNGWNPWDWHTPPAPTGLTVKYYGPSTNLCVQWNPSPGPVTSYIMRCCIPALGQTNTFTFSGQTSFWNTLPSGSVDSYWPPTYQVMAQYPGGPSAWSAAVSIYNPATSLEVASDGGIIGWPYSDWGDYDPFATASASVVRGPQGHLYLVTGYVPPGVASLRVSVTLDPNYIASYPWSYEANYLWEVPQPFTNAPSGGSCEVSAALLQSGFYELPVSLVPLYGVYDVNVETVAADGTVSDCPTIVSYAKDAWAFENGAIPFLDGRRQIKENAEFQLRAAQGYQIWSPGYTNRVPFAVEQLRTTGGSSYDFLETAQVDYVTAGFHYFWGNPGYYYGLTNAALTLDVFRPFEQNYFYANFLPVGPPWLTHGQSCDSQDYCTPLGIPYWPEGWWEFEVDQPWRQFSVSAFVQSGMTNSIPDLLSPDAAQWLFLDPGNGYVIDTFGGEYQHGWTVSNDFPNLYGLNLLSVQALDWTNSNPTPVTYYPGQTILLSSPAYFFDVVRPQLSNTDYYFARSPVIIWTPDPVNPWDDPLLTLVDPRPGEPGFTTSATTPLMIAPIGQPLFLTAWAKQAILNGFNNKFAYLEQYFTNAYTMDGSGNSAGLLSPYGEFFPMQPGPAALVTMPDIDPPYQQGTGVVNVIKLQLDVNHDGTMDLSFGGPDNTSQVRPFVFWLNNDCDIPADLGGPDRDYPVNSYRPDYTFTSIHSQRDLEDFARLWICGVPALTNGGYQVTLSWANISSGNPVINLFPTAETNGGIGYLTNTSVAQFQAQGYGPYLDYGPNVRFAQITNGTTFTFPANFFTNYANKYFLFEGANPGSGELMLTITQNGTNVIAQTGAWLDLHKIEDFYEQAYVTNVTSSYPPSDLTSQYSVVHYGSGMGDETKQVIVYVHGINRPDWGAQNEGETMFKRLYWSGYHGHFAMFKWPCTYLPPNNWWPYTFNLSEFYAYKSATALRNYLTDLRNRPGLAGYAIDIIGHSQGNAVASEALAMGAPFDNYILTQGAVPAHCYDGNAPSLPALLAADEQTPTPFYAYQGGYYQCWTNIPGHMVNFFNTNDFALKSGSYGPKRTNWEVNQETQKPESFALGPTYSYWPASGQSSRSTFSGSQQVTDPQEIRSMVARSHSAAIGAQEPAQGQTGQGIIGGSVDLFVQFGFDNTRAEHSAQFTRSIQTVWGYYDEILLSFGVQPVRR